MKIMCHSKHRVTKDLNLFSKLRFFHNPEAASDLCIQKEKQTGQKKAKKVAEAKASCTKVCLESC